ncbi:MAG: oxidoreductase [Candidatus Rokuibacteriota bacterium]|nr:MAG: oxidoreductase [Candidatus Rokubacteria bacterium]
MRQVFSTRGQVTVEDVPSPMITPGAVRVQTAWSLVSSGTERTNISGQRLVDRIRREPEIVGKVWDGLRRTGVAETVRLVRDKMERPIPLGNSLAGVVEEVGAGVTEFAVGDRVACGGTGHANHAEYVVVPRNLVVKVPESVELRDAAFVTLGAIALNSVRRARAELGETVVVVGLGLIGLLTVQILRAAGARVIGVDVVKDRVGLAERLGAERGIIAGETDPVKAVLGHTAGVGADAVLLTAGSESSEPVNQGFEMARARGRVVIVGSVGMDLLRETFYRKELDLVMSRSTGPGRYDPSYEERGIDYPLPYVRWTERRNMEAVLQLIAEGTLRVGDLVAGEFPADQAPAGYDALAASPRGVAVLLRYAPERPAQASRGFALSQRGNAGPGTTRVALVGTGEFARRTLLPALQRNRDVTLRAVVGGNSGTGLHDAKKFGAERYTTDVSEVLDDPAVDAVVIATRHHLHATLAAEAARRGKAVFVEKPLAMTLDECRTVADAVATSGALLTVGFNRRFAPLARRAKDTVAAASGPALAIYRVNARALPPQHWLRDPIEGGGLVLAEGCHFFDLVCWLLGDEPESVHAMAPPPSGEAVDEIVATIRFSTGSIATIVYSISGHPSLPKERIEILKGGRSVVLDDFQTLLVDGKRFRASADKGHAEEIAAFLRAVRGQAPLEVTVRDGVRATALALAVMESAATGKAVTVSGAGRI